MGGGVSPIDRVLSAADGERVTVNGRAFTRAAGTQVDGYADRMVFRMWNTAGRLVRVTVRETSKVVIG